MADESARITKNKRIELPGGAEVLFPVITRISFTDASDRYQETQHAIDNTELSDRSVHVAWVGGGQATEEADPGAEVPGDALAVERIDIWRASDKSDRAQETFTTIDNKTKDEDGPPYFTNHIRTHVLRVLNDPDDGNWIETEVIDEFSFLDPFDRNQETRYTLDNPPGEPDGDGNLIIRANPEDEEMDGGETVDPPYRTDPFQNIVNIAAPIWIIATMTPNVFVRTSDIFTPTPVTPANTTAGYYANFGLTGFKTDIVISGRFVLNQPVGSTLTYHGGIGSDPDSVVDQGYVVIAKAVGGTFCYSAGTALSAGGWATEPVGNPAHQDPPYPPPPALTPVLLGPTNTLLSTSWSPGADYIPPPPVLDWDDNPADVWGTNLTASYVVKDDTLASLTGVTFSGGTTLIPAGSPAAVFGSGDTCDSGSFSWNGITIDIDGTVYSPVAAYMSPSSGGFVTINGQTWPDPRSYGLFYGLFRRATA